ncbi:hypothetical protein DESC_260010 [Desulfosarcina cetonica]|nr:hypothetical protein DESC_260010 [Desulfosarcina cetonica]
MRWYKIFEVFVIGRKQTRSSLNIRIPVIPFDTHCKMIDKGFDDPQNILKQTKANV